MTEQRGTPDPLSGLRAAYFARLEARLIGLSAFVASGVELPADSEEFQTLHRCVHSMVSSAAIFGYVELSHAARSAELAFEHFRGDGTDGTVLLVRDVIDSAREVLSRQKLDLPTGT